MNFLTKAYVLVFSLINCIILILFLDKRATKTNPSYQTLPNRTFGVEFELTINIIPNLYTEQDICEIMMKSNNLPCQSAKYSDKDVKPYWKVKPDSSIACPWDRKRCFAYELVSPVLSGNGGLHQIYKQVEAMRPYKPSADYSSGFHVHVYIGKESKGNLKLENLKKILQNFIKYEQVFDSIMPRTRRGSINGYCKSIRNNSNLSKLSNFEANNLIAKMTNFVDLNQLVNPGQGILSQRNFKLNLQPILTLGQGRRGSGQRVENRKFENRPAVTLGQFSWTRGTFYDFYDLQICLEDR